jgi:hypothetical protein
LTFAVLIYAIIGAYIMQYLESQGENTIDQLLSSITGADDNDLPLMKSSRKSQQSHIDSSVSSISFKLVNINR